MPLCPAEAATCSRLNSLCPYLPSTNCWNLTPCSQIRLVLDSAPPSPSPHLSADCVLTVPDSGSDVLVLFPLLPFDCWGTGASVWKMSLLHRIWVSPVEIWLTPCISLLAIWLQAMLSLRAGGSDTMWLVQFVSLLALSLMCCGVFVPVLPSWVMCEGVLLSMQSLVKCVGVFVSKLPLFEQCAGAFVSTQLSFVKCAGVFVSNLPSLLKCADVFVSVTESLAMHGNVSVSAMESLVTHGGVSLSAMESLVRHESVVPLPVPSTFAASDDDWLRSLVPTCSRSWESRVTSPDLQQVYSLFLSCVSSSPEQNKCECDIWQHLNKTSVNVTGCTSDNTWTKQVWVWQGTHLTTPEQKGVSVTGYTSGNTCTKQVWVWQGTHLTTPAVTKQSAGGYSTCSRRRGTNPTPAVT